MKYNKVITPFFFILLQLGLKGQSVLVDTLVFEDFSNTPFQVNTYNQLNTSSPNFTLDYSNVNYDAPCMWAPDPVLGNNRYIETNSFSTIGKEKVYLSFKHIAKIQVFYSEFVIEYSTDNGVVWTTIHDSLYYGASHIYPTLNYFMEFSYPNPSRTPYWGGTSSSQSIIYPDSTWWAYEIFDLSSQVGYNSNNNGHSNVKVRFSLITKNSGLVSNMPGVYIDDILVTASNCNIFPNRIKFLSGSLSPETEGVFSSSVSLNFRVYPVLYDKFTLKDSVILNYRINNGIWQTSTITSSQQGYGCISDSIEMSHVLSGINMNDTVDWYIQTQVCNCDSLFEKPETEYATFIRKTPPPSKCGPIVNGIAPHVQSTFPYIEDFSPDKFLYSHPRGTLNTSHPPTGQNWTVNPAQNINNRYGWSVAVGSTPSNPHNSGMISSPSNNFLFTHVIGTGDSTKHTRITTSCIDLTGLDSMVVSYDYHMYGSLIDELRLEVDSSDNGTNRVVLDTKQGESHASKTQPMLTSAASLQGFKDKVIKLSFLGKRHLGTTNYREAFICIDNLKIYKGDKPDFKIFDPNNLSCVGNTFQPKIRIQNLSFIPIDELHIKIYRDNNFLFYDTLYTSISALQNTVVQTNKTIPITQSNSTIALVVENYPVKDNMSRPDSIVIDLPQNTVPISNLYYESFENIGLVSYSNSPTILGDWTAHRTTVGVNPYWNFHLVKYDNPNGHRHFLSKGSNNSEYYLALSFPDSSTSSVTATLTSSCIALDSLDNPLFLFSINSKKKNQLNQNYNFDIQAKGGFSDHYTTLKNCSYFTYGDGESNWSYEYFDLSDYKDSVFSLKFLMPGNFGLGAIAFDDFKIIDRMPIDLTIDAPMIASTWSHVSPTYKVPFRISNIGLNSVSNAYVKLSWFDACDTTQFLGSDSISIQTLQPLDFIRDSIQLHLQNMPRNGVHFTMEIIAPGDANLSNNVTKWNMVISDSIFNPFNTAINDCDKPLILQTVNEKSWVKRPSSLVPWINIPTHQDNVWKVGYGTLIVPGKHYLYLSDIIGLDSLKELELEIYHAYQIQGSGSFGHSNGGVVEYYENGNWVVLNNPNATNWYNGQIQIESKPAFVGSKPNFSYSRIPLPKKDTLRLRFGLINYAFLQHGWLIGAVNIVVPIQNDAAATRINHKSFPFDYNNQNFEVEIKNEGVVPLDFVTITLEYNDSAVVLDTVLISPPLNINSKYTHSITGPVLDVGPNKVCAIVSFPNRKNDENPNNDTVCRTVNIVPTYNNPYCSNFDLSEDFSEVGITNPNANLWRSGSPNGFLDDTPQIGQTTWFTGTTGYSELEGSYLYTPSLINSQEGCYKIKLLHQYQTEDQNDGGTIEYSIDNGATWLALGDYNPSGSWSWFNTQYIASLAYQAGWSGNSNGWTHDSIRIHLPQIPKLHFRFVFETDASVNDRGWAINEFCLEYMGPDCYIGLDEQHLNSGISVFPNPSSGRVNIQLLNQHIEVKSISVMDATGRMLLHQKLDTGSQEHQLDISAFADGLYLISIETDKGTVQQKVKKISE